MPNGLSPFLVASRGFRQAPVGTPLGALAQALAGFTGGLGAAQQQAFQRRQQAALGQALGGIATGQPIQPQTIQGLAQVSPQLAGQLALGQRQQILGQQATQQQTQLQQEKIKQQQQFEKEKIKQGQQFELEKVENQQNFLREQKKLDITGRIKESQIKASKDLPPLEKELAKSRAKSIVKAEENLDTATGIAEQIGVELKQAREALPDAITGITTKARQKFARAGTIAAAVVGVSKKEQVATRTVERTLKKAVTLVLKAEFGAQLSDAEREFMENIQGKSTFTREEIEEALNLIDREYTAKVQTAIKRVSATRERAGLEPIAQAGQAKSFEDLGI